MVSTQKNNGRNRIGTPDSEDYFQTKSSDSPYKVPALINFSDLGKDPKKLMQLAGNSLEDIVKKDKEVDTRRPEKLIVEYLFNERRLIRGYSFIEVKAGYTLLVYKNGKKIKNLTEGGISPSRRGMTRLVEIYTKDVEHTIKFPVLIAKTEREFPASISMTYRIEDPELFYQNKETIENGALKDMVKRIFNGTRYIINKNPLSISPEEYNKINQQLLEDLRPKFKEKGIELLEKGISFCIHVTGVERNLKNIEEIVQATCEGASEISRIQSKMEIQEKKHEMELLKAKQEFDKLVRDYKSRTAIDEERVKLQLETLGCEQREGMKDYELLHAIKREETKFELRKMMSEYVGKMFSNLESIAKGEIGPLLKFSLMHDLRIFGMYVLGEDRKEYRDFFEEVFEHKLKMDELKSEAAADIKKYPPDVKKAEALGKFINELNINSAELKPVIDYLHDLFERFTKKEESATETVNMSGKETQQI